MTFSDLFKVTIIQCQITWKWYNIQLHLQWRTNRKSYMIYRIAPFSVTLNDSYPQFQGHVIFWRWISQTVRHTDIVSMKLIWTYTRPSQQSFRITLSDIEWLSKTFSDTKRRTVSLRQLSFLCWMDPMKMQCPVERRILSRSGNEQPDAVIQHWNSVSEDEKGRRGWTPKGRMQRWDGGCIPQQKVWNFTWRFYSTNVNPIITPISRLHFNYIEKLHTVYLKLYKPKL